MLRIGKFNPDSIIPTTYKGMASTVGIAACAALATNSPALTVLTLGGFYLANQYRTRWLRENHLFDSTLDNLLKVKPIVSNAITDTLGAYGLTDLRAGEVVQGHVLTRYYVQIKAGTKLKALPVDDIARDLGVSSVDINTNAGKGLISVDVPNETRETVDFADLMNSEAWEQAKAKHKLPVCLGVDSVRNPVCFDLASTPHLIVCGTTGSGKTVALNALILSLMQSGANFRLMISDAKGDELANHYTHSKHLLSAGNVPALATEFEAIKTQLVWLEKEMDRRFKGEDKSEHLVYVVDEAADIFLQDKKGELERIVVRLAQKSRSANITIVLGTQYPSDEALPQLVRANIPSRLGLTVTKDYESRVLIGENGCEKLLGRGDGLLKLVGNKTQRVHCALITEKEIERFCS